MLTYVRVGNISHGLETLTGQIALITYIGFSLCKYALFQFQAISSICSARVSKYSRKSKDGHSEIQIQVIYMLCQRVSGKIWPQRVYQVGQLSSNLDANWQSPVTC